MYTLNLKPHLQATIRFCLCTVKAYRLSPVTFGQCAVDYVV